MSSTFTPLESGVGGLLIGVSAALGLLVDGKITGISGIMGPLLRSALVGGIKSKLWQALFVLGIVIGGLFSLAFNKNIAYPPAQALNYSLLRYSIGGLAVGFGTRLGGGCTSGHGVCGLARLSIRSWISVPTFMLAAAVTVAIARHAADVGEKTPSSVVPVQWPLAWPFVIGVVVATMLMVVAVLLIRRARPVLTPFFAGTIFGLGLGCSGMTSQAKVLNFLDVGGTWDPSLAFVMGCALCVTFPAFAWSRREAACPLQEGVQWEKPNNTKVDIQLLLGAILFGIGWGLCGICPGPALASAIPNAIGGCGGYDLFLLVTCLAWLAMDRSLAYWAARRAPTAAVQDQQTDVKPVETPRSDDEPHGV